VCAWTIVVMNLKYFQSLFFVYVIASIAYIHPVYGAKVRTHDLLIMSPLPFPLEHGSRLYFRSLCLWTMYLVTSVALMVLKNQLVFFLLTDHQQVDISKTNVK
jgi:hypothetical protein